MLTLEPGRRPLAPLLREAADAGRIGASVYEGAWEDVGTAERLAALGPNALDPLFGLWDTFQLPREIRLTLKLEF